MIDRYLRNWNLRSEDAFLCPIFQYFSCPAVILHAMKFENLEMDKKMIKEEFVDLSRFD